MSQAPVTLAAVFAVFFAGSAFGETVLPSEDFVERLRVSPVVCMTPNGMGGCETISTVSFATATRGIEVTTLAFQIRPGTYINVVSSSDFEVGSDGICYPNIAADIMAAQMFLTNSLAAGSQRLRQVDSEGRRYVTNILLRPLAQMIGTARYCLRYTVPDVQVQPDVYGLHDYLDNEAFDEPSVVRLFPRESIRGLSLVSLN